MALKLITQSSASFVASPVSRETGCELGGALVGQGVGMMRPEWPEQTVAAPLLGFNITAREVWSYPGICTQGENEGIAWRRMDGLVYGVIELYEADFPDSPLCSALQAASEEAYRRIFRLLDLLGVPNLWRVWNYFAQINGESHGLERYRQFNIGRQAAFIACNRSVTGSLPAACAIGLANGPLSIAFLAGDSPSRAVENPRQVSAYYYPMAYGPSSPTFSRATLAKLPGQALLFVSGTASIVGHRSMHVGDAAEQCCEALANVAAVVNEANCSGLSVPFALNHLSYRVYVRRPEDFPAIHAVMATLGPNVETLYVQADICRTDLLVEIEAVASHALEAADDPC